MQIGTKIKDAIETSGFSAEQVAADADMSVANLYRIYKRESIESRYLIRICRLLRVPYSALLGPEDWLKDSGTPSGHTQTANLVGKNRQQISVGGGEEVMQLRHQLELCQVEKQGLSNQVLLLNEMLEIYKGK